ncbi:hypothetical protein BG006_009804 [Podila minutissima]|uniref:Uncharacterized protein n=1 Tax=Podila minutissima TaxID=64525 RepID=A0A9P5SDZ9_9FUNG|nr:hypothetical protein BG006_009804 [Podila minutissima]
MLEILFKAADEYNLGELCKLAGDNILAKLSHEKVIPFLFRTAHQFEMLRDPVVEYVATRCGAYISSESCQQEYLDHPKRAEIFLEMFRRLF